MERIKIMVKTTDYLKSDDAKFNYLKGLIRVAKADGFLAESEKMYFMEFARSLDINETHKEMISDLWEDRKISISFNNNTEKMFLLTQLIQLAWSDGEYSNVEKQEIYKIASEIGISSKSVVAVEQWVEEGITWSKRGEELLKLS